MSSKPKWLTSILGLYLLTFVDGHVELQGRIVGADGDDVIVGLYSWTHGYSSGGTVLVKRSDLYDRKRVLLFHDVDAWSEEATRQSRLVYERVKNERR